MDLRLKPLETKDLKPLLDRMQITSQQPAEAKERLQAASPHVIEVGHHSNLVLKPLESVDLELFASQMQEAFQTAVDSADEKHPLPVLPREDIDNSLANPKTEALAAWVDGELVGGAIVFADYETHEHECALLYVAVPHHNKGIGGVLWQAIEAHYPDAVAWSLCTPYFEIRNIHFYLKKCGFHIVDIDVDDKEWKGEMDDESRTRPDAAECNVDGPQSNDDKEEEPLFFYFEKRLDGCWENPGGRNHSNRASQ